MNLSTIHAPKRACNVLLSRPTCVVSADRRFEQTEARLTGLEQRFDARLTALDQRMDGGFATLDWTVDQGFRWTSGIILSGLVAIAAAILSQ